MKTKSFINKKNNEREANVLLENVKIVWCHIVKPDTEGVYADNKYKLTCLLPKKDKQTKELINLLKLVSIENNNKEIKGQKYPIKDRKQDVDKINDLILNEQDQTKKEFLKKCVDDVMNNYFMTLSSKFEIPVVDEKLNPIEDLETVIFNHEFVNVQFKLCQPKGKDFFSRFPQGVQLQEVKRFEKGLMFESQNSEPIEEDDDTLPF